MVEYGRLLQNLGEKRDWGLLHRLDKDTSGLVLIALVKDAYDELLGQFKRRLIHKTYWAIVTGRPAPAQGVVQRPLAEVIVGGRKRAVVRRDGRQAITAYRVLQSGAGASLVEARPKTGRLHQIRGHMASLECPVLGDETYGTPAARAAARRLCLHSAYLSLIHPHHSHRIEVRAPWPSDLANTLKKLGLTEPKSS